MCSTSVPIASNMSSNKPELKCEPPPHLSSTATSPARPSSSASSSPSAADCCRRIEGRTAPRAERKVLTPWRGAAPGCPSPLPPSAAAAAAAPQREGVVGEEVAEGEGAEEGEGGRGRARTGRLGWAAKTGRGAGSRGFRVRSWAGTHCRRHPAEEEERRAPGDLRCSRSEHRPPGCWAAGPPSSGREAGSDAASWTSESPGLDNTA